MAKKKKKKYDLGGGGWEAQLTATRYVPVASIIRDPRLQQRVRMNSDTIERYVEILQNGGELAPVKIVDEDGKLWMWDGHHTHEAAVQANVEKIRADIERGTFRDAWIKSLGANDKHGLPRSRADLRKAIDNALSDPKVKYSLLNEDSQYTFRSLAKWVSVSHPTVSKRWNKYHSPLILASIDREIRGNPPVGVSLETWLNMVAEDLHVPRWLVKQRKIDMDFIPEPFETGNRPEPDPSEPKRGPLQEETAEATATELSRDKVSSNQVIGPEEGAEATATHLISGKVTSDQVMSVEQLTEATTKSTPALSRKIPIFDLEPQGQSPLRTAEDLNDHNDQLPERLRAYPSERALAPITKSDLMEIIAGANQFGIHAYHFDHAVKIKVVYELDKDEVQELELKPPHQGVLLLHFPLVQD